MGRKRKMRLIDRFQQHPKQFQYQCILIDRDYYGNSVTIAANGHPTREPP
ncbi:hypothetical protein [Laceyella sediminis]|nr:hypothetical protein [Laceyella sediminis]